MSKTQDIDRLIQTALETYNAIDILICNAGINPIMSGVLDTSEAAWDKIFGVNLKSTWILASKVAKIMMERNKGGDEDSNSDRGSIVLVSSVAGIKPIPLLGAYSVSKTAMIGLTRVMAGECASERIR